MHEMSTKEQLIPKVIDCILNKKSIPVYGDGKNIRDWLYVEDHAKAIDVIFHRGNAGETYNVGGDCEKSSSLEVKEGVKLNISGLF